MKINKIAPNTVHIWQIPLDDILQTQDTACLNPKEYARLKRFANNELQNAFRVTHTAKRQILASYLGIAAKDLALRENCFGKPTLASDYGIDLRFNLSHTSELAALVICQGKEVGIDIERTSRKVDAMSLGKRYFCAHVLGHLADLSGKAQQTAFLRYWTQFEAFTKALGEGLRGGHERLHLELADEANTFTEMQAAGEPSFWSVAELNNLAGHICALVIAGQTANYSLEFHTYSKAT